MYQINSQSAKTLTDGGNVRLPRFQRKQTWNKKKNFALCISIFNDYPIGMFVLNKEKIKTKNGILDTLWLLDGRQRRNALTQIFENPEYIYHWGKSFIKFSNTDSEFEIEHKFWESIKLHLETDEDNHEDINADEKEASTDEEDSFEIIEDDDFDYSEYDTVEESGEEFGANGAALNSVEESLGLKLLLQTIIMCHKATKNFSGYTKPFDFSSYFIKLDYKKKDHEGTEYIDGAALTNFINGFNTEVDKKNFDDFNEGDFLEYLTDRYTLKTEPNMEANLKKKVNYSWERIKKTINLVRQIALKLHNTKVGVIELSNVKSSDAQNIFKLINSSGTTLAAVEILSAKPSWNRKIINPTNDLDNATEKLYKTLNVKREGIVRWDFPATLLDRLQNLDFIFKKLDYAIDSEFKTKVTLGFKILAAIYENGVTKEKVSSLSRSKKIQWDEIEGIVTDLEQMGRVLKNEAFFQYLNSWNTSLIELTSDAISINYVALVYKNWISKGKPMGNGTQYDSFKKEAFALFDRMIYEYIHRQWRGSSDSKIADSLNNVNKAETFKAISTAKWITLLEELIEKETIQDVVAEPKDIKPILYYYYVLSNKLGPNSIEYNFEMDHIISKSSFASATSAQKQRVNNLCNYCLLSKHDNNTKKTKSLHTIGQLAEADHNYNLMQQRIAASTDIPINKFNQFNTAVDLEKLINLRKNIIFDAFQNKRTLYLN